MDRALSGQRLQGYRIPGDDYAEGIARYLWNVAIAAAMQPVLHVLEVTLRNAIYDASCKVIDQARLKFGQVHCWLDATPSLLYAKEQEAVTSAKGYLQDRRSQTSGHLIAKLGFGFWVQLTSAVYGSQRSDGPRLWPQALSIAFPFKYPRRRGVSYDNSDREHVFQQLHRARTWRNRIAHHEPVWDRNPIAEYHHILGVLGWMNASLPNVFLALDRLPAVVETGHGIYRDAARQIVGDA